MLLLQLLGMLEPASHLSKLTGLFVSSDPQKKMTTAALSLIIHYFEPSMSKHDLWASSRLD